MQEAWSKFNSDFLSHFLKGLHLTMDSPSGMSLIERKRGIKRLADAAMAFARGSRTKWSQALIEGSSYERQRRVMKRRRRFRRKRACTSVLKRRRAQVLRRIVPGGQCLDGVSLLSETLDYVVCLRAQASIMQRLTRMIFGEFKLV